MIFKKGELFNGPGGIAVGAQLAKVIHPETKEIYQVEHEWANDFDEFACKTFATNICGDENDTTVHHMPVQDLPIGEFDVLPDIDCLTFGFPCNDFSQVGKKKGMNGEYGPLYSYGVKVLKEYKPKFFLAENVSGLESSNDGDSFIKILEDLKHPADDLEYIITPNLYKFEQYGIPQARHRIIIVGIRKDIHDSGIIFKVPKPLFENPSDYKTSFEAITNPPIYENALNHEMPRHSLKVKEMLSHIPPGENAWYDGIPEELRLNVKGAKISSIYKRLDPNKPAYTVTGSGGGGTHMYHWNEDRALTNRERARLQTFPDDFIFKGNKGDIRKQIGMAVPPEGAKIIFEAILKCFAKIPYESVEPTYKFTKESLIKNRNKRKNKNINAKSQTCLVF